MAVKQASFGRRTHIAVGALAWGLSTGLFGCSDAAVVTAQVKLQRAAAAESEVVATIPSGSAVKVSSCTNGWCSASWNGHEGYILAKHVRVGGARSRTPNTPGRDGTEDIPPDGESSEGFSPGD